MADVVDRAQAFCVIGAGAAGLTAAKNLLDVGVDVDVLEREPDLGGNWHYGQRGSSVYRSIHTITSKAFTEYTDFPMPDHYPTFLAQRHALEYLRSYARHFGVADRIRFGTEVERVEREEGRPGWLVTLGDGERRRYAAVVIANGHLWKPRYPEYPGTFGGVTVHSGEYKTPDVLRGRRVVVVGAGNSGCDIAVEASLNAERTFHSTRRGYHYWPKYQFGLPSDVVYEMVLRSRAPLPLRRLAGWTSLRLNSAGRPQDYGLPAPSQRIFEEHFIVNSTLMYHLGQGDLVAKPDIAELRGDRVLFTDGSEEEVDVLVYATGFHLTEFPFLDRRHLNWVDGKPRLFLNAFHPAYDDLFLIGYFQTSTGNWPLMDHQAQVMSRFVLAQRTDPGRAEWFRRLKSEPSRGRLSGGINFYDSPRHLLEVEHFTFRRALQRVARRLPTAAAGMAAPRVERPADAEPAGTPVG
jgi:cation diffusion facilitator CzcD-associated flavoprotein CzcO